jgi:hypothetical protein
VWIEVGDQSTKYFKIFANYMRNQNTIWELSDDGGNKVHGFTELACLGVNHFKEIFKEPEHTNMGDLLKLVGLFPCLIDEEENEALYVEIM